MSAEKPSFIANRYQLLEKLGQGGMGAVYKAQDRLTNQTVALKQVLLAPADLDFASRLSTHADLHVALAQEFRTLASLRHPNIISVLDYGFSKDRQPFFTMEYIESSQNFVEAAKDRSTDEKVELVIQLLQAVAYLHRRKILHRDLKPDNIRVIGNTVKTLDFGLAMVRRDSAASHTDSLAGTFHYMAPELFDNHPPARTSDLWAVGVMMYEMFAGKHPFDTRSPMSLIRDLLMSNVDVTPLDLSVDLKGVLGRLLIKQVEERYDDAFTVIDALYAAIDKAQPTEDIKLRESFIQGAKFVGRATELQQLQVALNSAISGKGSGWLIGGESGVGKSRLLDELRSHALVEGVTVLRGQGVDGGGLPFQLWRDPIRRMVLAVDLTDMQKQILKEIVPDIGILLDEDVPDAPQIDGKASNDRLTFAIMDVFNLYSHPTLLILDDLHWTAESLEPLKHLNRLTPGLPLLIVGSYRNDEKPDLPGELPGMQAMTLSRLNDVEIVELSESMLGAVGTQPQVLDVLKRETEGNAFFMVEVVHALAEEAGRMLNIGRMTLPESVLAGGIQRVITRRLNHLPDLIQMWLKPIAVAGRQLDMPVVDRLSMTYFYQELAKQVTGQLETDPIALGVIQSIVEPSRNEILALCANAAVLEVVDGQWQFSHDKIREALLADLTDDERPRLHRQVAEVIEAVYPDDEDHNEVLLEHWHQAGDIDKEIDYLSPVALYHINSRAEYQRARELLERGLRALPKDDVRRIALWNLEALSHIRQGNFDQVYDIAQQAWQLAEQLDHQPGIAASLNQLGEIATRRGEHEQARDYFQQSLGISQSIGEREGIVNDLNGLGLVAFREGDHEQARDYFQQSIDLARQISGYHGVAGKLNNLGIVTYFLGDYEQAQDYFQQSLDISEQSGNQRSIAEALNNLGMLASLRGEYERVWDYFQRSLDIARHIGDQHGIGLNLTNIGFVHIKRQNTQAAQSSFCEALPIAVSMNIAPIVLEIVVGFAWLYLQQNRLSRAGELAGLAQQHPAHNSDVQLRLNELLPQLEEALSPEDLQVTLERGKSLDLEMVVEGLLRESDSANKAT